MSKTTRDGQLPNDANVTRRRVIDQGGAYLYATLRAPIRKMFEQLRRRYDLRTKQKTIETIIETMHDYTSDPIHRQVMDLLKMPVFGPVGEYRRVCNRRIRDITEKLRQEMESRL